MKQSRIDDTDAVVFSFKLDKACLAGLGGVHQIHLDLNTKVEELLPQDEEEQKALLKHLTEHNNYKEVKKDE